MVIMGIKSKIKVLGLIMVSVLFRVNAQQEPIYTQYMYNMNIINPAYAGSVEAAEFTLGTRLQWLGFDNSPKTLTFSASTPVNLSGMQGLGAGLSVVSDQNGPQKSQDIYVDFSYKIQIHKTGTLSLGIKTGGTANSIDASFFDPQDPAFSDLQNVFNWNVGAGLYYQDRSMYLSLSIPKFLKYSNEDLGGIQENRNVYLTGGYVFEINRLVDIKPSFLMRYSEAGQTSFDINTSLLWYKSFETGISYRFNSSVSLMFNMKVLDNLRIGYAYDYGVGDLLGTNLSSHEFFILFDLQSKRQRFTSPRFF
jgi:type IX secretion system PorP/SprF family membrane protein